MKTRQEFGTRTSELPNAEVSGKNGSRGVERRDTTKVRAAEFVRKAADREDSRKAPKIETPNADVAGLRRRMAMLFPELVRSQQHGKWCIKKTVLLGEHGEFPGALVDDTSGPIRHPE